MLYLLLFKALWFIWKLAYTWLFMIGSRFTICLYYCWNILASGISENLWLLLSWDFIIYLDVFNKWEQFYSWKIIMKRIMAGIMRTCVWYICWTTRLNLILNIYKLTGLNWLRTLNVQKELEVRRQRQLAEKNINDYGFKGLF